MPVTEKKTDYYWLSSQVLLHSKLGFKELKLGFYDLFVLKTAIF